MSLQDNEQLNIIVQSAPIGICILDAISLKAELLNDKFLEIAGKPKEAIIGKWYWEPFAEVRPYYEEALGSVAVTGEVYHADEVEMMLIRHGREEKIFVTFVYAPVVNAAGTITKIAVWVLENTKRVNEQRVITANEARLRALVTATSDVIYSVSADWELMYELDGRGFLKDTSEPITGWRAQNVHPDDLERVDATINKAIRTKTIFQLEHQVLRADGSPGWTFSRAVPILDHQGEIVEWFGMASDITERKRIEEALARSSGELQAINEELVSTNEELHASNEELDEARQNLQTFNTELEQRIAERTNELSKSEAVFRNIFEQSPLAMSLLKGRELVIESANELMLQIWGKTADVIGLSLAKALPELEGQPFLQMLDDVYVSGKSFFAYEMSVLLERDGIIVPKILDFVWSPVLDEKGIVESILVTAVDGTERASSRQREKDLNIQLTATNRELLASNEALMAAQKRLEELNAGNLEDMKFAVDAAELATFDYNPLTNRFNGNERLKEWFGLPNVPELELSAATKVIAEKDRNRVIAAIQDALDYSKGKSYDVEYTILNTLNPIPRLVRAKGKALFNKNKQPVRLSGTLQDITEQKNALAELEASNQRLELALGAANLGSYQLDLLTGKMICTEQCKKNFGIDAASTFDFPDLLNLIRPEYRDDMQQRVNLAIAQHVIYHAEYQIQRPDGEIRWIAAYGQPKYNDAGDAVSIAGVTSDITAQKETEAKKDTFIGMVSHELKTPLTSLKSYIQVLYRDAQKGNDQFTTNALANADKQVNKMSSMINGFLNVARLESGQIQLTKTAFDLSELITECIAEVAVVLQSHQIIYAECPGIMVWADREKIGQVIHNLISNAIKYSPKGKEINNKCRSVEQKAEVSIRDEGIGITVENIPQLFDRFYRVDNPNLKHVSGFGIGLYLSNELVKQHGGNILVKSALNEGSTFLFDIPLANNGQV
ncbi:PAS domain-containing protein [Pedobacter sp. HMF7647]|uniref:histidine kinase n=1 Tax=Hufsiella arboris TaxID=2695275 RepID=A0A7K1YC28_9SPHI|nr:PAS domain-containing protein [Hufsiella arboris]MXV51921.1 PAS domain-containing protein [Hufsiella arboris]